MADFCCSTQVRNVSSAHELCSEGATFLTVRNVFFGCKMFFCDIKLFLVDQKSQNITKLQNIKK